jgi:hypothetical protein
MTILSATWLDTFTCANSGSNYVGGTQQFGQNGGVNGGGLGEAFVIGTIANGATYSVSCYGANSTTTSATLYGYCDVKAEPE